MGICVVPLALAVIMMIGDTCNVIEKKNVFYGFVLDSFYCKLIISVCKFYELYFNVGFRMRWWSSIVGDSLDVQYVWFKASIAVTPLWSIGVAKVGQCFLVVSS